MEEAHRSADAPGVSNVMVGDVWAMNAATDGEDCVAVRLSFELWEQADGRTRERVSDLFEGFCRDVESLF